MNKTQPKYDSNNLDSEDFRETCYEDDESNNMKNIGKRINQPQDSSFEPTSHKKPITYIMADDQEKDYSKIIQLAQNFPTKQTPFISLQKWEGYVLEIKKDSFIARLVDLTNKKPDEEAEIYLEEISDEDRNLLKPGAIFYWNIGYDDEPSGRQRVSFFRFRRMPAWTQKEIDTAKIKAKNIQSELGWN